MSTKTVAKKIADATAAPAKKTESVLPTIVKPGKTTPGPVDLKKHAVTSSKKDVPAKRPAEASKKPTEAPAKPTVAAKKPAEAANKPASAKPTEASKKLAEAAKKPALKKPADGLKKSAEVPKEKAASQKPKKSRETAAKPEKQSPAKKQPVVVAPSSPIEEEEEEEESSSSTAPTVADMDVEASDVEGEAAFDNIDDELARELGDLLPDEKTKRKYRSSPHGRAVVKMLRELNDSRPKTAIPATTFATLFKRQLAEKGRALRVRSRGLRVLQAYAEAKIARFVSECADVLCLNDKLGITLNKRIVQHVAGKHRELDGIDFQSSDEEDEEEEDDDAMDVEEQSGEGEDDADSMTNGTGK